MKKAEKTKYLSMPCIAYHSSFNGVEIKDIEYCIDDLDGYVIAVSGAWSSNKIVHRVALYYEDSGEPYFMLYGVRIYLYACIREDVGEKCTDMYRL